MRLKFAHFAPTVPVFGIFLRTNSDFRPIQRTVIGFYNRNEVCLLRSATCFFKEFTLCLWRVMFLNVGLRLHSAHNSFLWIFGYSLRKSCCIGCPPKQLQLSLTQYSWQAVGFVHNLGSFPALTLITNPASGSSTCFPAVCICRKHKFKSRSQ